ncbi:hypothetical protein DEALK_04900 [Dehalogenimonas alkenigignens]|uniref:Uncharacterized protein n=1 Tax=Dehalogenimonas alkenigignens TaxID=1217799 RepID=A0A0W0GGI6_9CHLR|nr:hypothetical protein DEALK_04900 [Dehalogenimonas alkenigignens]
MELPETALCQFGPRFLAQPPPPIVKVIISNAKSCVGRL